MRARMGAPLLVAACLAAVPVQARRLRLELERAGPVEAGAALERLLGVPVEVRGGHERALTLTFVAAAPRHLLDRLAAAYGGTWRLALRVQGGRAAPTALSPALKSPVSVGLRDVTARRAVQFLASQLGAELTVEGELDRRVSLFAVNVPASTVLDRISEQAGTRWSAAYVIQAAGPVPEPVTPLAAPRAAVPPESPGRAEAVPPPADPLPAIPTVLGSGPQLRTWLLGEIARLLKAEPGRRREAAERFVRDTTLVFDAVALLPGPEARERLAGMLSALAVWKRAYAGMAPEVRRELAPVDAQLNGRLRP